MKEYDVLVIVIALLTAAISIGAPVIKLNTSITKLIVELKNLGKEVDSLDQLNYESHKKMWKKNEDQDLALADHETRIKIIEIERKE